MMAAKKSIKRPSEIKNWMIFTRSNLHVMREQDNP